MTIVAFPHNRVTLSTRRRFEAAYRAARIAIRATLDRPLYPLKGAEIAIGELVFRDGDDGRSIYRFGREARLFPARCAGYLGSAKRLTAPTASTRRTAVAMSSAFDRVPLPR